MAYGPHKLIVRLGWDAEDGELLSYGPEYETSALDVSSNTLAADAIKKLVHDTNASGRFDVQVSYTFTIECEKGKLTQAYFNNE